MPRGYPGTHADHGTLSRYRTGCGCPPCLDANRRYGILRDLDPNPRKIDSTGTARKLQALIALGWSGPMLGERLGVTRARVGHLARHTHPTVTRPIHNQVDALYRELCMTPPPTETKAEHAAYLRALTAARKRGWAPPLAWDNIDDPTDRPQGAGHVPGHADPEEWLLLVRAGEDPERAATRLGVTVSAIAKAARRAGLPHIAHEADSAKRAA
ncbi:MAG: hypothetical protein K0S70_167 [Microbacterium sp.]|jgi:hypothetical protein|nr:hypothetical protein [Microbacterium sp.]